MRKFFLPYLYIFPFLILLVGCKKEVPEQPIPGLMPIDWPNDDGTMTYIQWQHFMTSDIKRYECFLVREGKRDTLLYESSPRRLELEKIHIDSLLPDNFGDTEYYILTKYEEEVNCDVADIVTQMPEEDTLKAKAEKIIRVGTELVDVIGEELPVKYVFGDYFKIVDEQGITSVEKATSANLAQLKEIGTKIAYLITGKTRFEFQKKRLKFWHYPLITNTTYYYKFRITYWGESYYIHLDSIKTVDNPPEAVWDLKVKKLTDGRVTAVWDSDEEDNDETHQIYGIDITFPEKDPKLFNTVNSYWRACELPEVDDYKKYRFYIISVDPTCYIEEDSIPEKPSGDSVNVVFVFGKEEKRLPVNDKHIAFSDTVACSLDTTTVLPPPFPEGQTHSYETPNDAGDGISIGWGPPTIKLRYYVVTDEDLEREGKELKFECLVLANPKTEEETIGHIKTQLDDRKIITDWEDRRVFEFNGLEDGPHTIKAWLCDKNNKLLPNPEAVLVQDITVDVSQKVFAEKSPYAYEIYSSQKSDRTDDKRFFQMLTKYSYQKLDKDRKSYTDRPDSAQYYEYAHFVRIYDTRNPNLFQDSPVVGPVLAIDNRFHTKKTTVLISMVTFIAVMLAFIRYARKGKKLYVRPIAGIDHVDEALGRATEMGKPILYILGLTGITDIATLAGITILGRVARKTAEYDSRLLVPCYDPIVMTVAQEVVKEAYLSVGRPDVYNERDIYFVTQSQFAYVAAVNGLMIREKTATNFYMGMFFAESLLLTETGSTAGSIQIAGSDAMTQLPFFITTCDYTLIGEELYAASAYLSNEPILLGSIKGQDWVKAIMLGLITLGTVFASLHWEWFVNLFKISL